MSPFIADLPVPAMGATVSELTVVNIVVAPGATVAKGQKLAELESDKSAFDFESPAAGTVLEILGAKGAVMTSGQPLFRMQTDDDSLRHLEGRKTEVGEPRTADSPAIASAASAVRSLTWTPRAIKMAQQAGLDHAKVADIVATGPGGRVSGDDVVAYLASRK